ncbi:MAG TPA: MBL fold metallo-hydrolase, partial [Myxococcaceae bacterium]|nr:MBL fold metallo-hydrolase [Myxococcaceae bacterium]
MTRRVLAVSLVLAGAALAQDTDFSKVEIKIVPVAGGVSMLVGQGGNIGVTTGKDGTFLIDDQFAPLLPKIRAAVKTLGDVPIRFVVNTHFHGDHTGSNALLGESGTVIIAQDNVRRRLGVERVNPGTKQRTPPQPPSAWPLVTYADGVTLFLNGDELEVTHVLRAHTDGDSLVRFKKANVIHMGDVFFNGSYPFIDVDSGGSVDGILATVDKVLPTLDAGTKVIPGHGPLGTKADLQTYRDLVAGIRDRVKALVAQGKTMDQVIAAKPTAQWDEKWGKGFMGPDVFVSFVYRSLTEA